MVGMMVQGAYYFVDRVFVGQALDPDALAGITIAFPYMLVLQAASMLIGIGAAALVSIKLGEKKTEEAERVLGNAATMLLVASLVLTVVGSWRLRPVLQLMRVSDEVLQYAYEYLQIMIFATGFQLLGYGLNAVIRAEGNTRTAMWTLLIGVLLNCRAWPGCSFSSAFIGALDAGRRWPRPFRKAFRRPGCWPIFSAAAACCGSTGGSCGCTARPAAESCSIGSPMFAMQLFGALMLASSIIRRRLMAATWRSPSGAAIYALFMVANMPVYGINQGTQPIVGFNYGARRFDRVKQALLTGIVYASTLTIAGFVVAMVMPGPVMDCSSTPRARPPALIALGVHAMRICFLMSPLVGFQVVSAGYFQATGKPREATFLMLSRQVLLLIPLVWILPQIFRAGWRLDGPAGFRFRFLADHRRVPVLRAAAAGRAPPRRLATGSGERAINHKGHKGHKGRE